MAKFSVEGDEDGNEEEPTANRRMPKKPRTSSDPAVVSPKGGHASTSNSGDLCSGAAKPASTSAPPPSVRESRRLEYDLMDDDDDCPLVFTRSLFPSSLFTRSSACFDDEDEDDEEPIRVGPQTEAPVNLTPDGKCTGLGSAERRVDSSAPLSVTLTDPDVLDCAICFEPLNPPVYQCENGHIACASCCTNMKNKCASCSWPIGYNRCRAIEKVIESVRISCRNMQHGCSETLNYSKKLDHEKTCKYAPCSCPHPDCTYIGLPKSIYAHFATQHSQSSNQFRFNVACSVSLDTSQNHVFLQEKSVNILFVINRSIEPFGSLVNVVCIDQASSEIEFYYEVSASDGVSSIKLRTVADITPQWIAQPPVKRFVIIPNEFMSSSSELMLELTIWRDRMSWLLAHA